MILEGVTIVHGQTLTIDFGETELIDSNGDKYCSFCVTMIMETEPNGNWILDNTYEVRYAITLTYLNQSIYDNYDFSIYFNLPVTMLDFGFFYEIQELQSYTHVTLQNMGNLSRIYRPVSAPMEFEFFTSLVLKVYYEEEIRFDGVWQQSNQTEPIMINVEHSQSDSMYLPFNDIYLYLVITVAIFLILIVLFLKLKKKNSSRKNQKN